MVDNSNDETKFPHKPLLTNAQVSRLHKVFVYGSSANLKISKTQLSKVLQLGRSLGPHTPLDNIIGPAFGLALEVTKILSGAKGSISSSVTSRSRV